MERNLKLILAYDGTRFHGWQRQPDARTVQEELEAVARRILRHPLDIIGASRTDAGVHARGQVAHVHTPSEIPLSNIFRAIGHRLPEDLALVHMEEAPAAFHAIHHARSKLYRYRIHNDVRRPVEEREPAYAWHIWWPLDVECMQAAADLLVGTHDFAAFASAGCTRRTTIRTILSFQVRRLYRTVFVDVVGTGFLYNQVRNMVGTLVEIGRGHWLPERIREILASADRAQAGPTAPPYGLCLQWIKYPSTGSLADEA